MPKTHFLPIVGFPSQCQTIIKSASYYKTRSVCGFVWAPTPPLFMDRSAPNLAERSWRGTEKNSRAGPVSMATIMLSWQPKKRCFCGQSRTAVGYKIACDVIIHDVTSHMMSCDVTLAVTSWKPSIVVSRHLGASALF